MLPPITFVRSKVARRLLLLFLLCALVPIVALSILSYRHVTSELYEQSRQRLHRASKSAGMRILDHLQEAESRLIALARHGAASGADPTAVDPGDLIPLLTSVSLIRPGRPPVALLGPPIAVPEITPAEDARLAAGQTVLLAPADAGGQPTPLLLRRADSRHPTLLAGRVDPQFVFDISHENALPAGAEFCVLDEHDVVLACQIEDPARLVRQAGAELSHDVAGHFTWMRDGERYLASQWAIFLKASFGHPGWRIVVTEPVELVLAPVQGFRTIFPLTSLLAVLLALLFGVRQIQRRLGPLERLREGTRRIAAREFDAKVEVASGDEFEELAHSFNSMAGRLGEQFEALSKMIDIDRAILSAAETNAIVDAVLDRLPDLYVCDFTCVALFDEHGMLQARSRRGRAPAAEREELTGLSLAEAQHLHEHAESEIVDLRTDPRHYLAPISNAGMRVGVVLPLFLSRELVGLIALGHRSADDCDSERVVYARQLADQTSTALANARTLEQNRGLAYYDSLTGLPNRLLFKERLGQNVLRARRQRHRVAVCLIDLDGFKRINDTLGHDAGDELLKEAGERLTRIARSEGVARLGGDEFTVLITDLAEAEDAARVAARAIEDLAKPFRLGVQEVFITASAGISVYPDDGDRLETLVKNADVAMYHAKDSGRNNYQFFSQAMNEEAMRRLELEQSLRAALEREELRLFYQPVVDTQTRSLAGAEALIRWQHPTLGLLGAGEFVPLAEDTGLIVSIGAWALQTACRQAAVWMQGGRSMSISVNLSQRQFREPGLAETVRSALRDARLSPAHLVLELTETLLMGGDDASVAALRRLKDLGVKLSVDDFGTGYSSLSYLKQFPVDVLKIDRSFVCDLETSLEDDAITCAVVGMAHQLRLAVVAEGVETEGQFRLLSERGCDQVQGFLFGEPMPIDAFEKWMEEREDS